MGHAYAKGWTGVASAGLVLVGCRPVGLRGAMGISVLPMAPFFVSGYVGVQGGLHVQTVLSPVAVA